MAWYWLSIYPDNVCVYCRDDETSSYKSTTLPSISVADTACHSSDVSNTHLTVSSNTTSQRSPLCLKESVSPHKLQPDGTKKSLDFQNNSAMAKELKSIGGIENGLEKLSIKEHQRKPYDELKDLRKSENELSNGIAKPSRKESTDSDILVLSRNPSMISTESELTLLTNPSQRSFSVIDSDDCEQRVSSAHGSMVSSDHGDLPTSAVADQPGQHPDNTAISLSSNSATELSPCGSLTNKTLNSMIESVYEKSMFECQTVKDFECIEDNSIVGVQDGTNTTSVSFYSANSTTPHTVYGSLDESSQHINTPSAEPVKQATEKTSGDVLEVGNIRYWCDDFSQIDHKLKLYLTMTLFDEDEDFSLALRVCIKVHFLILPQVLIYTVSAPV